VLGGSQAGVVGDVDGDVVFTVVEAFAVVDVDDVVKGDEVVVVLAGSDVGAVAGTLLTGAVGLVGQQTTY